MSIEPGIRCRNCHWVNRAGARFCARCGAPLDAPLAAPPRRAGGALGPAANLLAGLAALGAAVLLAVGLPLLALGGRLLDAKVYQESLRAQNVYARLPDLLAEQMALSQASLGRQAHIDFTGVGPADWKLLAQALFPPEWTQAQVERLLDELFAGAPPTTIKIPLADVTARLTGDPGLRLYQQLIQSKRECGFDDFFEIVAWIEEDASARLPICNIPPDLSDIAAFLGDYDSREAMIRDLLAGLPAQLPKELSLADVTSLRVDRAAGWLRLGRLVGLASLGLAGLALLLTLAAPRGRRPVSGLLLWGLPLAAAGAAGLLEALLLPRLVGGLIAGGGRAALAPGLADVLRQTGRAAAQGSAAALAGWSAGLLAAGALLCLAAGGLWAWGQRRRR